MVRISGAAVTALIVLSAIAAPVSGAGPGSFGPQEVGANVDRHAVEGGVYTTDPLPYAPDRVVVRFRDAASPSARVSAAVSASGRARHTYTLVPGLETWTLAPHADPVAAVAGLSRDPNVEYASLDYAYPITIAPNDPSYSSQWGLQRIGAQTAWDRSTGSLQVTVAILDTGIDASHPDLAANVVPGWNFVANNATPVDDNGHGTHVAGIIGAVGNNAVGVAGINWSVSLMPLKICNSGGSCFLSAEIAALDYATTHGATVANASFGAQSTGSPAERDAIAAAGEKGLMFVAAAGNNSANNDASGFYPASYPLDNVIAVGASTSTDTLAGFSNYGATSVDLVAPGVGILSTLPGGYGSLDGTSMAAPFVTGAAALVRSLHLDWTVAQLRTQLLGSVAPVSALSGKVLTCGRLDLAAATSDLPVKAALCVAPSGSGVGRVTSSPAAIDCGATCAASFAVGSQVTLNATADPGSTFIGWSGPCSGTGACTTTLSSTTTVRAMFRGPTTQAGWSNSRLKPPKGRPATVAGTVTGRDGSFFNVSLSSNGKVRAKTLYTQPQACSFDTTDTGGVFIERKTRTGWKPDGVVTSPRLGDDSAARWPNCEGFGAITKLSGDGSTLLVGQPMGVVLVDGQFVRRCVAFVYRRGTAGWSLDGTLFPPNMGPAGSPGVAGCVYFGAEGAISADGSRVAILAVQPAAQPGDTSTLRAIVFVRGTSGWTIEKNLVPAPCSRCGELVGAHMLAMSADGATVVISSGGGEAFHTFRRSGTTWSDGETVFSSDRSRYVWFGHQVAISADGLTMTTGATDYGQWSADRTGGVVFIYQRINNQWVRQQVLTTGRPTPDAHYDTFECPAIVSGGSRIVCASFDTVGYNEFQGSLYVFDRAPAGWSSSPTSARMFAAGGLGTDRLGVTGPTWRISLAAREDGSVIDATINVDNVVSGGYPNDRIGYQFRR